MPELPEVETITRELSRAIIGKKISKFSVFDTAKIIRPRLALPRRIVSVNRHGKFIVFNMGGNLRCILHLRMTGELLFERQTADNKLQIVHRKHERARFSFSDGSVLRFRDVRRFGTIDWLKHDDFLPDLGVDPLSAGFSQRILGEKLASSNRAIKSALLDQGLVAGIGNIYADESLWTAGIHPMRRSSSLRKPEIARLVRSIRKVLREAIKKGGFTLRDYRRTDGSRGDYQNSCKAYGRESEKCLRCGNKIRRIKVSGRSSYFCQKCQK